MLTLSLLLIVTTLGHLAIWVAIFNRLHASKFEHRPKKRSELVIVLLVVFIWLGMFTAFFPYEVFRWQGRFAGFASQWRPVWATYAVVCWVALVVVIIRWGALKIIDRKPRGFVSETTELVNIRDRIDENPCGDLSTKLLAAIPGNQILQLAVHEKTFRLEYLPPEHDGLTITHLSDLHFTGRLTQAYFEEVFQQANQLESDIIAVTGDIIDKPRCLDWIVPLFSSLSAPLGLYYILGNHDTRIHDNQKLRDMMSSAGATDLVGTWRVVQRNGSNIRLAGNELPWFPEANDLDEVPSLRGSELRILLSHSPDQFRWGQDRDFDLILAGHTHGGQIRPPVIGPIVSPSRHGGRYASGVFHRNGTLMHVSRGVSGVEQIRLNCRPELTKIHLRRSFQPRSRQ